MSGNPDINDYVRANGADAARRVIDGASAMPDPDAEERLALIAFLISQRFQEWELRGLTMQMLRNTAGARGFRWKPPPPPEPPEPEPQEDSEPESSEEPEPDSPPPRSEPRARPNDELPLDAEIAKEVDGEPLRTTMAVYTKWLDLPDRTPIYVVLGTVAANLLPGDPVWTGIIAPPSSAKTEILNSVAHLEYVKSVATVTPPALLSGTPAKQKAKGAKGGLLAEIGSFGILVLKDFGSILSMRPDAKAEVIAALREIFDGRWGRDVGSDGGRRLTWAGKLGLIFGRSLLRLPQRHRQSGR
jgi:hypothetical protein